MKKVLPIILLAAMLLTMLLAVVPVAAADATEIAQTEKKKATVSANYVPADYDNDGVTDADAVKVTDLATLKSINGKKAYLANDIYITLNQVSNGSIIGGWPAAGNDTYFDGCGYTIHLYEDIDTSKTAETGWSLFHGTGAAYHFKNLNIVGKMVAGTTGAENAGILIRHGFSATSSFENIVVDVEYVVKEFRKSNGAGYIGYLISKDDGRTATFTNVHTYGSLTVVPELSGKHVGVLIGSATGAKTVTNCSTNTPITIKAAAKTTNVGGVFGLLKGASTFNNVEVTGDIIQETLLEADSGCRNGVGGIIGALENGNLTQVSMTNVVNRANITTNSSRVGVGGLIGVVNDSIQLVIRNSANYGKIDALLSKHNGDHAGVAGLVGAENANNNTNASLEIYYSENHGEITVHKGNYKDQKDLHRGGLVGRVYGSRSVLIDGCVNTGNIGGEAGNGWDSAGGILAAIATYNYTWSNVTSAEITITDCVNTGSVSGGSMNGGIFGAAMQVNSPNVTLAIDGCANYGTINNGEGTSGGIAGKIGESSCALDLNISDCYNAGLARAGIVHNVSQAWATDRADGKNSDYDSTADKSLLAAVQNGVDANGKPFYIPTTAYTTPEITNCVNTNTEVAYGIVGTYGFNQHVDDLANSKINVTSCASEGQTQVAVPSEAKYNVTAPANADEVLAAVKGDICENTPVHDALELNEYLAATCTEGGHNAHYYCETCGTYWDADKVGTTEDKVMIPAIHDTLVWKDEIPADCTTNGTKAHYACTNCNKNYDAAWVVIDDITITAIHDTLVWKDEIHAGCTSTGTKGHFACTKCGKNYDATWGVIDDLTIKAIHDTLEWNNEIPAGCTTDGTKAHYACTNCNKNYDAAWGVIDDLKITAIHDTLVLNNRIAPTYDDEGVKAHYECTNCGKYYDAEWNELDDLTIPTLYETLTELEKVTAEIKEAVDKLDVDTVNAKIEELAKAIEQAEADANSHAASLDAELEKKLLDAIATAKGEAINAADTALKAAKDELQTAINNKADQATLEKAITDLTNAINTAEQAAKDYAEDMDAVLETELLLAIADAKTELENADKALAKAIEDLKAELDLAVKEIYDLIAESGKATANVMANALAKLDAVVESTNTALEKADEKTRKELEAYLAKAELAIEVAVNKLGRDLDDAVEALEGAIDSGDDALSTKIDVLNDALKNAEAALAIADSENVVALINKMKAADEVLNTAIKKVADDLKDAKKALKAIDDANKAELMTKDDELMAKDSSLQTFIIVVCVISCVTLAGSAAFVVWFFLDKKKKIG